MTRPNARGDRDHKSWVSFGAIESIVARASCAYLKVAHGSIDAQFWLNDWRFCRVSEPLVYDKSCGGKYLSPVGRSDGDTPYLEANHIQRVLGCLASAMLAVHSKRGCQYCLLKAEDGCNYRKFSHLEMIEVMEICQDETRIGRSGNAILDLVFVNSLKKTVQAATFGQYLLDMSVSLGGERLFATAGGQLRIRLLDQGNRRQQ